MADDVEDDDDGFIRARRPRRDGVKAAPAPTEAHGTQSHHTMPDYVAERYERDEHVHGLAATLRSPQAEELYRDNYAYVYTVRDGAALTLGHDERALPVRYNRYGDVAVFRRRAF